MSKGILLMTAIAMAFSGVADVEALEEGEILSGIASQYGPGRMESTIRVRQAGRTSRNLPTPLPEADVYFAAIDCRDVGNWFLIRPADLDEAGQPHPWESAYATDCAGLADGGIGFMLFNRHTPMSLWQANLWLDRVHTGEYQPVIVAEVDYPTAVRWQTVGRGKRVDLLRLNPIPGGSD